jgi:hypothetical protein
MYGNTHLIADAIADGLRSAGEVSVRCITDVPPAAAFDTRVHLPAAISGRASKGIARRLRKHGATLLLDPESFFVTKENELLPEEEARARAWGTRIAPSIAASVSE